MSQIKRAIYPGHFDPITNGHVDIIERALRVFDEVIVVVASNSRKAPLLSAPERVQLIEKVFDGNSKVKVDSWGGLIMDYARKNKVQAVIRGLRAASDFEYEFMMAAMNKNLNTDVETFFMMTGQDLFFISSSMIKELYEYGGSIDQYVPKPVVKALGEKKK